MTGLKGHRVYPIQYFVTEGELQRGFTFYGPFESHDQAWAWVTDHFHVGSLYKIIEVHNVSADL